MSVLVLKIVLLFLAQHTVDVESYRVLGLFPFQGRSHYNIFEALLKELLKKGHMVDVVNHFPQKEPIPGWTDLSVSGTLPMFVNNFTMDLLENIGGVHEITSFVAFECGNDVCDAVMNTDVIRNLRNSTAKYDVIITEIFGTDCLLGFQEIFKVPVIEVSTTVSFPWGNDRFGLPDNPSYIPNLFGKYTGEMNLWQRIVNTYDLLFTKLTFHFQSHLYGKQKTKEFFGDNVDLDRLIYQGSFYFLSTHFSIHDPRPLPPNCAEIGGIHIDANYKIDPGMEAILDASDNGVILMSLGSMICTETFDTTRKQALLNTFGGLNYTVIWKGIEEEFPKPIPKNIVFRRWIPQLQILCHRNTKAFVTHGGLLGTQEAVYCGVPLLVMPFFGDQHSNAEHYVGKGIAKKILYADLTYTNMVNSLRPILEDRRYRDNAKTLQKIYRDRPMSPSETVVYWTDYVIKHNGAPHLRPHSTQLAWYQLLLLDVLAVVGIVAALIGWILYKLAARILRLGKNAKTISNDVRDMGKSKKKVTKND